MVEVQQIEVRHRSSNGIGTASLVLGILACLVCWIPFIGILGIPIAVIGIILAGIGLLIGVMRHSSTGGAVAGGIVSLLAIIISVFITGKTVTAIATGIASSNQTVQREQPNAAPQDLSISANQPQPTVVPEKTTIPAVEWGLYSPDKYFVQGDIAVRIGALSVGKVKLQSIGRDSESKDDLLSLTVYIKNQSDGKKIEYRTWGDKEYNGFQDPGTTLTDNFDNNYRLVSFGIGSQPKGQLVNESIYPGKELTDVIVFEAPVDKATELKLALPASNFGGQGFIRVRIPNSIINKNL